MMEYVTGRRSAITDNLNELGGEALILNSVVLVVRGLF
jgi:hypothetical protein